MKTINIGGLTVEIGAGVYHKQNYYVRNLSTIVTKSEEKRMLDTNERLGIWNGKEFVFETRNWRILTIVNALYRYGFSPATTDSLAEVLLNEFLTLYGKLNNGHVFEDVSALLKQTFAKSMTDRSLRSYLLENGIRELFIDEIVTALTRINYNQDSNLSALAGMVALVGSGDDISAPKLGMQQICKSVLEDSQAKLKLSTTVESIRFIAGNIPRYQIRHTENSKNPAELEFDAVIVAAPLEFANIKFEGFTIPEEATQKRAYRTTHVSIIAGERNKSYFGVKEEDDLPHLIGTLEDSNIPFNSLTLKEADNHTLVYKIFTREYLSDGVLAKMFKNTTFVYRHEWPNAYPFHVVNQKFAPFKLHDHLYYPNTLESMASCMEVAMVSSRNTVNMLRRDWRDLVISGKSQEEAPKAKGEL